ncbi:unnamed protein product [Ilex paraguariensis]|uniref:Reverse transcriptase domain-containing protein n=1 Tax=Ilex paraguariensis TaxID=185542 RepID=A0ABC8UU99_9AQUA
MKIEVCDLPKKIEVYGYLSTQHFSICLNGQRYGYFPNSRGLRQGDPLSPSLFILAEEVLSRGLRRIYQQNLVSHFHIGRGTTVVSHLLFADDTLVFMRGTKRSVLNVLKYIGEYESCSGQKVNKSKSAMYCSKRISVARRNSLSSLVGIPIRKCPFSYLGCPIIRGRVKFCYFEDIMRTFRSRIEGWYAKMLSGMGRIVLVQSVLSAIPTHMLACLNIPKGILRKLNSYIADFIWSSKLDIKRRH